MKFIHNDVGFNYKITNIHAAIGLAQLEKLNYFLKKKKIINKFYKKKVNTKYFSILKNPDYAENNLWMNILRLKNGPNKANIKTIIKKMKKANIDCRRVWKLNHRQRPYNKSSVYKVKNAYEKVANSICIPSCTSLSKKALNKVVKTLNKY